MESSEILLQVSRIAGTVLGNDKIVLTPETTTDKVEGWDSFIHLRMIRTIEKHFHINFNTFEIQSWRNIGDLCDAVKRKLPS